MPDKLTYLNFVQALVILINRNVLQWSKLLSFRVLIVCLPFTACTSSNRDTKASHTVIKPGEVLEFRNPNGTGRIHYLSEFKRRFELMGSSFDVKFIQRQKEFAHQLGIYNPGAGSRWPRFVVEESEVKFQNTDEVIKFLKEGGDSFLWVSNGDGYVVGYDVTTSRVQINVSVYKFYLNDKIMRSIPKEFQNPGSVAIKRESH